MALLLRSSPDDVFYLFDDPLFAQAESELLNDVAAGGESISDMLDLVRSDAERYEQVAASLGFTGDELLDLRQRCSRYAATLPTLNASVRQDVRSQLWHHYLEAAYSYVSDNPPDSICIEWPCE